MKKLGRKITSLLLVLTLVVSMAVIAMPTASAGMITNIVTGNFTAVAFELMERTVVTLIVKAADKTDNETVAEALTWTKRILGGYQSIVNAELLSRTQEISDDLDELYTVYSETTGKMTDTLNEINSKLDAQAFQEHRDKVTTFGKGYENTILEDFGDFLDAFNAYGNDPTSENLQQLEYTYTELYNLYAFDSTSSNAKSESELFTTPLYGDTNTVGYLDRISSYKCSESIKDSNGYFDMADTTLWGSKEAGKKVYLDYAFDYAASVYNFENNVYDFMVPCASEAATQLSLYLQAYRYYVDFNTMLINSDPSLSNKEKEALTEALNNHFEESLCKSVRAINQMYYGYSNVFTEYMRSYDTFAYLSFDNFKENVTYAEAYDRYSDADVTSDNIMSGTKGDAQPGVYQFKLVNEEEDTLYTLSSLLSCAYTGAHKMYGTPDSYGFSLQVLNALNSTSSPEGLHPIKSSSELNYIMNGGNVLYSNQNNIINNIKTELLVSNDDVDIMDAKLVSQNNDEEALKAGQFMILDTPISWTPDKDLTEDDARMTWLNVSMPTPKEIEVDAEEDIQSGSGRLDEVYMMYKGTPSVNVNLTSASYYPGNANGTIEAYTDGSLVIADHSSSELKSSQAMTLKLKPEEGSVLTQVVVKDSEGNILERIYGEAPQGQDKTEYLLRAQKNIEYMPTDDNGNYELVMPVPCQDVKIVAYFEEREASRDTNTVTLEDIGIEGTSMMFDGYNNVTVKEYLPGETVIVNVLPADISTDNYNNIITTATICDTLEVTDSNGNAVEFTDISDSSPKLKANEKTFSFTMPDSDVTVKAKMSDGYSVTVACDSHSSHLFDNLNCFNFKIGVQGNSEEWSKKNMLPFAEGDTVSVVPMADNGYTISSVFVYTQSGYEVDVNVLTDGTVTFEMPDENVVVSIHSEEASKYTHTATITYSGGNSASFTDSYYVPFNTLSQRYNTGDTVYFMLENNRDATVTLTAGASHAEDIKSVELTTTQSQDGKRQLYSFTMPTYNVVIKVENPLEITTDKSEVEVSIGDTETVKAIVTPEDAQNKTVIWESSDSSVATVEDGVIKGVGLGTATITARLDANKDKKADIQVNVIYLETDSEGSFIISNYQELCNMKSAVETGESKYVHGNYIVVNDFTCPEGASWSPVTVEDGFMGTLDGQGFTIKNLTITDTTLEKSGLFITIGETGVVKNLNLEDIDITVGANGASGGIASESMGTISGCQVSGTIKTDDTIAFSQEVMAVIGGITSANSGVITNCTSNVFIVAGDNYTSLIAGGIVGMDMVTSEVSGCFNNGTISSDALMNFTGGIAGMSSGIISKCGNYGDITVQGWLNTGGIAGYAYKGIFSDVAEKISNSFNTGNITVKDYSSTYPEAESAYQQLLAEEGETYHVGGLFGNIEQTGAKGCYTCGNITIKGENVYGATGFVGNNVTIDNYYYLVADGSEITQESQKYMSEFNSGEVAYLLNGGITDGTQVWFQNLDNGEAVDASPKFEGGTVYESAGNCLGQSKGYTNTTGEISHNYNNYHVCKDCYALREGEAAGIYGFSIGLGGNISVQYYMVLDEDVAADESAKMIFSVPSGNSYYRVAIPVSEAQTTAVMVPYINEIRTFYIFECEVAAKEMASDIYCQVVTDTRESDKFHYTVKEYAEIILSNPQAYSNEIPLVKAMLNYGAEAQLAFGHNLDNLANDTQYITEDEKVLQDVDFSSYAHTLEGSEEGVSYYGSALSLKSETAIKHYFYFENETAVESTEITVNGKAVTPTKNGSYYEVKVSDIPAHKLNDNYEVKVGGLTLNYSTFSYCNTVTGSANDNGFGDVAKALYAYNRAALQYRGQ